MWLYFERVAFWIAMLYGSGGMKDYVAVAKLNGQRVSIPESCEDQQ